jgi:hypothetical protein
MRWHEMTVVLRDAGAVAFLTMEAAIEQLHETIQAAIRSAGLPA